MFRRLRRSVERNFYQMKGAVTGFFWVITKGLEHYNKRITELDAELKKQAAEISDAEERIVWTTVGQALTAWATMEEALVTTVCLLLRTSGEKGGLIMYSIINFNVWLSLIADLFALDEKLSSFQSRWNKLSERIRRIKDIRDRLAHESAHQDPVEFGVLKPSRFDSRAKTKLFKPLARYEIQEFTRAVMIIADDVVTLCQDMSVALGASERKSPEPSPCHSPGSGSQ